MNDPRIEPVAQNVNVPEEKPVRRPTLSEEVVSNLFQGTVTGVGFYGVEKLFHWLGMKEIEAPFSLSSYVFVHFSAAAFVQTAKAVHLLVLNCLGDRDVFTNLEQTATYTDSFRKHTWTIISAVEGLENKIDALFSHALGINSMKEIEDQGIEDKDLDFLELLRREALAEAKETIPQIAAFSLALPLAAHCGLVLATGNSIIWITAGNFFFHTLSRIQAIKDRIVAETEERRLADLQNPTV
jgi:hypothetical protein